MFEAPKAVRGNIEKRSTWHFLETYFPEIMELKPHAHSS